MSNAIYKVPQPTNEVCLTYAPNSPEKKAVKAALKKMRSSKQDIPMVIGGKDVGLRKKAPWHHLMTTNIS